MTTDPHLTTRRSAIADVGNHLLDVLPPAFLMLIFLNAVFLGMILWFLSVQMEQRNAVTSKVIDACVLHMKLQPTH